MEEKDLINRIKKSFKKQIPRSEITKRLQKRGYKIEYIDKLILKAKAPQKKIISIFVIAIFLIFNMGSVYVTLHSLDKHQTKEIDIASSPIPNNIQNQNPQELFSESQIKGNELPEQTTLKEIINEEFITNTLVSLNLGSYLHKHPLTQEPAIVAFKIDNQTFYSEINKAIVTKTKTNKEEDILIITTEKIIIKSQKSPSPTNTLKESINQGTTQIEMKASEGELFAKGYLSFYNNLQ